MPMAPANRVVAAGSGIDVRRMVPVVLGPALPAVKSQAKAAAVWDAVKVPIFFHPDHWGGAVGALPSASFD